MLHKIAGMAATAVYKRAVEGGDGDDTIEVPPWVFLVVLLNLLAFLPFIIYMGYTLGSLFPVLAIVENTNPPAYQPVSLNEDAEDTNLNSSSGNIDASPGRAITSSMRSINRLLYSVGGWRSSFRGIWCAFALAVAISFVGGIFSVVTLVPSLVGTLLASLALVQLSAAWVHIVISPPIAAPFWRRLPPFKRTLEATWLPTLASWLAATLAAEAPVFTSRLLNLPGFDLKKPHDVPAYDAHVAWKSLIVLLVSFAVWAIAVVPANVLLVRVQASLLPPDEETIIPFDRSFEGTIEPAVVGGKGYVTVRDALNTVTRADWVRIYLLHAKIFGAIFVMYLLIGAVLIPEVLLLPLGNNKPSA